MRRAVSCLIALCSWAVPALSQVPNNAPIAATASSRSGDYQLIQQIEDDWLKAERSTDPAALDRILADDFVNLAPNGPAPGKDQLLKNWRATAGQAPPYTVETADMRIYILGDTAVAAYSKTYTAKENGKAAHEDTTHVFTKEHGVWKLRISRSSFR